MGVDLLGDADHGLLVRDISENGPMAGLGASGARLISIRTSDAVQGTDISLQPLDIIEEPDAISDAIAMRAFLSRQGEIAEVLSKRQVSLTFQYTENLTNQTQATVATTTITPAPSRPMTELPLVFWVQIGVGLFGVILGSWVLALRRADHAVQFFVLAGFGLMIAAHSAALYSTRELALPTTLFTIASRLNFLGTMLFGIGMINMFLIYPARWVRPWVLWAVAGMFGLPVLKVLTDLTTLMGDRQLPVVVAMLVLIGAILAQVVMNRSRPLERAMLGWFGLSVLLGAGGFVLTAVLPVLLGGTPQISQGYAFLFFLIIYAGLALGIARFRLFDLAGWSFRVLFYLGGALLLLALDAVLIYVISLERVAALGISLAMVGLVYLPLRDQIGNWLRTDTTVDSQRLFAGISDVTLATTMHEQMAALRILVHDLFDPLRIDEEPPRNDQRAQLLNAGEGLLLPMPSGLPSLRLYWARQGKRLFSTQDANLGDSVIDMLDKSITRQRNYDRAVEEERRRISRDVHDNIGVQLLGALHSTDGDRKNNLIRQTLSDLRQIISSPLDEPTALRQLLADLRAEIGEHLDAAGLQMDWNAADFPQVTLSPHVVQTLRALLREASSNVIRHANATSVIFTLSAQTNLSKGPATHLLTVEITDNGIGIDPDIAQTGNGLKNIRHRIAACGGEITLTTQSSGTHLRATLVLDPSKGTVVVGSLPRVMPVQGARHDRASMTIQ